MSPSTTERRRTFRDLHETGCFVIPNPWDIGTARYLEHLGFKALATTSGGFAFSQGLPDGTVTRETMLAHIRQLVEATDLPVNADFQSGYGSDPESIGESGGCVSPPESQDCRSRTRPATRTGRSTTSTSRSSG